MPFMFPDGLPDVSSFYQDIGKALCKQASTPQASLSLAGRLYLSKSGWILLSVPNSLVRGAFEAMDEPGVELPPSGPDGRLNAHISVMRPEELEQIGGPDKITERGKLFRFNLGPLKSVNPASWGEMSKVWFIEVNSPELKKLRKSYGLPALPNENKFQFHVTVAVRRKGVLQANDVAKAAEEHAHGKIPEKTAAEAAAQGPLPSEKAAEPAAGPYTGSPLSELQRGILLQFLIQRHLARKAGPHTDFRVGDDRGLYSWASRKPVPDKPGERALAVQQPMHSPKMIPAPDKVVIPEGQYGAGELRKEREGQAEVGNVGERSVTFSLLDRDPPQQLTMIQPEKWPQREWLMTDTTKESFAKRAKALWQRTLSQRLNTPHVWRKDKGLLGNASNYLATGAQMFRDNVDRAYGGARIRGVYDPGYKWNRIMALLEGDNMVLPDPTDQFLARLMT